MATIGSAIVYSSLGMVLLFRILSKDPRPWKQKKALLLLGSLGLTAQGTAFSLVAYLTYRELPGALGGASGFYASYFDYASEEAFRQVLTMTGTFLAVELLRVGIKAVTDTQKGRSSSLVKYEALQSIMTAGL